MDFTQNKFDLKIFMIDKTFYELKGKNNQEIIDAITDNHKKKLHSNHDYNIANPRTSFDSDDSYKYWSYCYNEKVEKYYWKLFLPEKLTNGKNFHVTEFSFVLFIEYQEDIYCVISGSGISVIKKYIHSNFGIDIYQRLAKPKEDIVIEINTRGIANNVSQKKQTFNINQTLLETIEYSEVPSKIKLKVRDELKLKEFKKYNLDDNFAILEVGSYFLLLKKISFDDLKLLIADLHFIRKHYQPIRLSLFSRIENRDHLDNLNNTLIEIIIDDVIMHNNQNIAKSKQRDIIEIVHPSKLELFYECDHFKVRFKNSRENSELQVEERGKLYYKCTKYIFDTLENISDRFEVKSKLYNLSIVGYRNDKVLTRAPFFAHVTAEVSQDERKFFRIDGNWYYLEDYFLKLINEEAIEYYKSYRLQESILSSWPDDFDEDDYNKSYTGKPGYFVLDKVLKDNIELCDILVIKGDKAYFVHVKNGFDTNLRELYIQIILSAKRLSNDLKNNSGSSYLLNSFGIIK